MISIINTTESNKLNTSDNKNHSNNESIMKASSFASEIKPEVKKILDSLSKDYTSVENLEPSDISYEDYKKLSFQALKELFPVEENEEKLGQASRLSRYAQLTDDDTLNSIYYASELEAQKNSGQSEYHFTLGVISIMELNMHLDANGNNIVLDLENNTLIDNSSTLANDLYTTKDKLFSDFDKFKKYYEDTKENWTGAINMNEVFKNMDDIKELYAKKVQENNSILNAYTRNTKEKII